MADKNYNIMAEMKVKFRMLSGDTGEVYYQIVHRGVSQVLSTRYRITRQEWECVRGMSADGREIVVRHDIVTRVRLNIMNDRNRLAHIVMKCARDGAGCRVGEIVRLFGEWPWGRTFAEVVGDEVVSLRTAGRYRMAESYSSACRRFLAFCGDDAITFAEVDVAMMTRFQELLCSQGLLMNTVSYYMRVLRAIYRRVAKAGVVWSADPFGGVYTGVAATVKRALGQHDISLLRNADLGGEPALEYARDVFMFSFYMRGMSFVDIAYLRKKDISNGYICYRRHKTGGVLMVKCEPCIMEIVTRYSHSLSPYLFPFILSADRDGRRQFKAWQQKINRALQRLGCMLGLPVPLTMYVARHSWASIAYGSNIPLSVVSAALGHCSEATTRIYLATLDNNRVDEANRAVIAMV